MYSIVTHLDSLLNFYNYSDYNFKELHNTAHVDLLKMQKSNVKLAVYAIFVEPEYKPDLSLKRTIQLIDRLLEFIDQYRELKIVKDYRDIEKLKEDEIGIMIAIEGADGIFDLSALHIFYRLGVRMISLTWNQRNHLADGIGEFQTNGGLSQAGREIIGEMEKLKIIVDVSHLSPAGFWDIDTYTRNPYLASHSNSKSICSHPRNLDDEQLIAIKNAGGVIGLNFAPAFIEKKEKVEINDLIKHIDYIKELIGIESIILGTDFDGINSTPVGLENIAKLNNLANRLAEHGYNRNDIENIFYNNALSFFKRVWK